MTLKEFRREYPEYDDVSDGILLRLLKAAGKEIKERDGITEIVQELRALAELIKGVKIDVPETVVNVPETLVNFDIPAPIVNFEVPPAVIYDWVFTPVRDNNGFIRSVTAHANIRKA